MWDISVARLHKHCLPLFHAWCMEVDILHTQVDMLYFVPGASSQGLLKSATPSDVRQRSPIINRCRLQLLSSTPVTVDCALGGFYLDLPFRLQNQAVLPAAAQFA